MDGSAESDLLAELAVATEGDPAEIMRLLGRGIPLTLLVDLLSPNGPDSAAILREETGRAG
jgi:hypothetical protein